MCPVCCSIAFAFLGKSWMFFFIAGQNRNANTGAWRSLLILSPVVFLLRRLVEYTRTEGAEVFAPGRALVSLTTVAIVCSLREIESGKARLGSGRGGFWEGFSEPILRIQRHGERLRFSFKIRLENLVTAPEKRNPLYSSGICCFSGCQ